MKSYHRVKANIDLDAFAYNLDQIHNCIQDQTKVFCVVKADAYGHGALELAQIAEEKDFVYGFCVATVAEGVALREANINKPILILGYSFEDEYEELVSYDLISAVFTLDMAKALSQEAKKQGKILPIHLKIDTGMSRIGMQVTEEDADLALAISQLENIKVEGIFTHFAKADETDKSATQKQFDLFLKMVQMLEDRGLHIPYKHCSNSAGIIDLPEMNLDFVRAGIILYGLWPSDEVKKENIDLKPVLSLISHISYIKTLEKGRSIGYGGSYTLENDARIATIPVGYADGYPRSLSNKGYVLIHGVKAPIRGRVCMDQFMVDISHIPDVQIGDEVILIGTDQEESITIEEIGELSGRFNYEQACDIGKRVPRVFYKDHKAVSAREC